MRIISVCIIILSALGCSRNPATNVLIENSIHSITGADTIKTIIAFAQCQSPQGSYTTEVHSDSADYTYFKQVYSYRDEPFEAVVIATDSVFQVRSDSIISLPTGTVAILKGHEFHEILLEPGKRFHVFSKPEQVVENEKSYYRISAQDKLNNPVELFLNVETGTLDILTMRNPDAVDEVLRLEYSARRKTQGLILPMHVEILQGDKRFSFDFTSVKINDGSFRRWSND